MTEETIKKLYKHFSKLAEKGGNTDNKVRNELIKSDAKRNKEEIEEKHPEVIKEMKKSSSKKKKSKKSKKKKGD